ncbi:MAG: alpha/beta fold hydrolase [Williamsia herbipolensis]|nr:alpha/beta fold hydrolase [Williamsia herbipolensis]
MTVDSHGTRCAGWLYRAEAADGERRPIVVLGHGLGAVKEMRLDAYAERFADAGYHALAFDYRHFGASGGEPRQLLDVDRQREDWHAAIAHARSLPGVDPDRVVLFGSSFGGGHVLVIAAQDPRVAAAIAQCPFTDGVASARASMGPSSLAVTARAVADTLAAARHKPRVLVPLAGRPGQTALMNTPDALDGYLALVPEGMSFSDEVAAAVALRIPREKPGKVARSVTAPVLFGVCENDTVAPAAATIKHAERMPNAVIKRYPVGHFDIYLGDAFETAVADYVDFLDEVVGGV